MTPPTGGQSGGEEGLLGFGRRLAVEAEGTGLPTVAVRDPLGNCGFAATAQ